MTTAKLTMAVAIAAACIWPLAGRADEAPQSDTGRLSYALGYQIGGDFRRQQVDLDATFVLRGIGDARSGVVPAMSADEMRQVLVELKRKVVAQEATAAPATPPLPDADGKSAAVAESAATAALAASARSVDAVASAAAQLATTERRARRAAPRDSEREREFLNRNAKREGVVTLPDGLQYKVSREGKGRQPQPGDQVALIYRGSLANGDTFSKSDQDGKPGPRVVALDALVPGLREAVALMKEGAQWRVVVPPELGFNASTPLFRKVTVFDLELVAVNR